MKNLSKFSSALVGFLLLLLLGACASNSSESDLAGPNENLEVEIEDQPAEQIWDLIPSSLPRDPVARLSPITDDLEKLQASLDLFKYEEGDGDYLDYELKYMGPRARELESVAALASNRERDGVTLSIDPYSLWIPMNGAPTIWTFVSFEKTEMDRRDQALCQGMLFEVAGEAIYLKKTMRSDAYELTATCELPLENNFEIRGLFGTNHTNEEIELWPEEDGTIYRLLQLLTEHPFTVRVLDLRGTEHVFISDEPLPYRAAFEAEKAVKSGLGY